MAYLMRKISPELWTQDPHDILCKEEINAESLADLCAYENAISTWYVGNKTEAEITHAVVALTSEFRSLDGINIVFLDAEEILAAGISIQPTEGRTKIQEYAELHRDINQLNAGKLLTLAQLMLKQIAENQTRNINAEKIALWLLQSMCDGKLKFEDLDGNLKMDFACKITKLASKKKIDINSVCPELWEKIQKQQVICRKKSRISNTKKNELIDAIIESKYSYREVMTFICS